MDWGFEPGQAAVVMNGDGDEGLGLRKRKWRERERGSRQLFKIFFGQTKTILELM